MITVRSWLTPICIATLVGTSLAAEPSPAAQPTDPGVIQRLRDRITAGDADAMYTLATMQQYGTQIPLDLQSAEKLMNQAAARKHPLAQDAFAMMYMEGAYGMKYMPGVAYELWLQAANDGNPIALYQVAMQKRAGVWTSKDPEGAKALLAKAADIAQPAAEAGDIAAMVTLGQLYQLSDGPLSFGPARAALWQTKAMEKGYFRYAGALARIYASHPELGGSPMGLKILRRAADVGDADAQYVISEVFAKGGMGVEKDASEARKWLELAAAREACAAFADLGLKYHEGWGVTQDMDASKTWLERGISRGDPVSMRRLGIFYAEDKASPNFYRAVDLLARAGDLNDPAALCCLAQLHHLGKLGTVDDAAAFRLVKKAADLNDPQALELLSTYYFVGCGVPVDRDASFEAALRAGNLQYAPAMLSVGLAYEAGGGTIRDYSKAKYWLDKAAAAGDPDGLFYDAKFYADGYGTKKDLVKARLLLTASAQAGNKMAMCELGQYLAVGLGGGQDIVGARRWMQKAADLGDAVAQAWLRQNPPGAP